MFFIFFLNCILFVLMCLTLADEKDIENESDVWRITIKDLAGDYEDNPGKEIDIEGHSNQKAIVFPKKSLFSKKFQISECTGSTCSSQQLSKEERIKFDKCNFEGHILSDPESKVSVVDCKKNGTKDISIVSEKANLTYNSYRINSAGDIEVPPKSNFSDISKKGKDELNDYNIEIGEDYSDDKTIPVLEFDMFIDKKMSAVTVMDVDSKCCRPVRTYCKELTDKIKTCNVQKGKILCERGEWKNTCLGLKDYVKKKAEKQREKSINEENRKAFKLNISDKASKNSNREEDYDEEDYDSAYGESEETRWDSDLKEIETSVVQDSSEEKNNKNEYIKRKQIRELSKYELMKLIKEIHASHKISDINPKCTVKENIFRSKVIIAPICNGVHCRKKEPVPDHKMYTDRTVEIGVFIDKHLYQKMSEDIESSDNEKIKEAIVEMVHGILVGVEDFFTHKTFTTLEGGFKIALNRIQIFKDHNDISTQKWDEQVRLDGLLENFHDHAMKVNGACDAEENSFDGMILFTGRTDFEDVEPGTSVGYSYTGAVCEIAPVTVMTLGLNGKGSHQQNAPQLLSHELGHLLGSEHDGRHAKMKHGVYYGLGPIPCPAGKNLMSPSVSVRMNTWSTCTQKMIDAEYERREIFGKNCFYT